MVDCGANVDARPSHLVQFAKLGSIYMENIVGIKKSKGEFLPNPTANVVIEEGDVLVIITDKKTVESFNKLI